MWRAKSICPIEGLFYLMSTQYISTLYRKSFVIVRERTSFLSRIDTSNLLNKIRIYGNRLPKNTLIVAVVVLIVVAAFIFGNKLNSGNFLDGGDNRLAAPSPLATQDLNKTYKFPLYDAKGKEVSKIDYIIQTANLQDAFIYQGKVATAVKGRTFLIFDLKITNPYSKTIEINAKDYVRVKLNGTSEQLAPEIHNDPVQIQANSTKYTRIGLPINDSDKNIVLLVGELQGKKDSINLSLKK